MQPTLFPKKVLQQLAAPKAARVYTLKDIFPFGTWKGKKLSVVANLDPQHLERWQQQRHIRFDNELQHAIQLAKFLNR